LLSCLEKRDLLNQSAVSVDKLMGWGARYEEAGQINDAVDFYERANAAGPLEALLEVARDDGDAFLYGRVLKALGRDAPAEEWILLGEKARELGKHAFALEAFKRGGLQEPETEQQGEAEPAAAEPLPEVTRD
jgi:tetratricopeptide (TPR) repeat protein